MPNSSHAVFWGLAARFVIFLLIVGGIIYYLVQSAANKPVAQTLYLADPLSACAYPQDTVDIKKLNYIDENGNPHNWDQFTSLEEAKKAGYHLCH
jgi:hypothetical protein